jgi:hypothetical protein|tara:strand:- start:132 stop:266 length:135 start_codon:yes stop_codon:yes gene_type:complete
VDSISLVAAAVVLQKVILLVLALVVQVVVDKEYLVLSQEHIHQT